MIGSSVPDWPYELAAAIRDRAGSGRVFKYNKDTGALEPCTRSECGSGTAGPETVIVYDWAADSNDIGEGFSEGAGESLFAALVMASQVQPPLVNLFKLHLIGHSRGTVVNSEAAERMIAAGYLPRQVTSIDPHDWGAPFVEEDPASGAPEAAEPEAEVEGRVVEWEDFDVNSEHPEYRCGRDEPSDPSGMCAWIGTGFNDNYFQEFSLLLDGRRVRGAANLDLSDFDGWGIDNIVHSNIHRWYHCTVDPTASDCDPEWFQNEPDACSHLSSSDPPARLSTFSDVEDGFFFSRLGGGSSARCAETGSRQLVHFDFGLREGFVNGGFDKAGSGGNNIPGWSFHGGHGPATVETSGNNYLELEAGEYRFHNRFYVPLNTSAIGYCWFVDDPGTPEFLRLVLTGGAADEVIGQQEVSGATGGDCALAPVPSSHWDQARRLKVEVVGPNPSSGVVVGVDEIGLLISIPCTYSILPSSRAHAAAATSGQTVSVTAPFGCAWTATSHAGWITVTGGASGDGSGTVTYALSANPSTSQRVGTMTIAGETFTVTQEGIVCAYSIEPTSRMHPPSAASGQTVSVTAPAGCPWTAASNDGWITVTGGSSGNGNGTVTYSISENASASQRVGTITIAGEIFTVIQQEA
ncbi:MAG: BACON domain-containing protein, partial [bacterium]|nr:BACON domain-containing protein [bacterium]